MPRLRSIVSKEKKENPSFTAGKSGDPEDGTIHNRLGKHREAVGHFGGRPEGDKKKDGWVEEI